MGKHKTHILILVIFCFILSCLSWTGSGQYSITGYDPIDLQSEDRVVELFRQWGEKHSRTYQHMEETLKRFENFKRNLKYVIEKNSNRTGCTVGLNRFADLSNEEFREMYLGKVKIQAELSERRYTRLREATECHAPLSLDWRDKGAVTAVKDQGHCGSCWTFSTTGAIEGINAINTGKLISLSEQELLSCDTVQHGCDGGNMNRAFNWVIHNGGIDSEADYPYTASNGICNANKVANKVVSIDGYKMVTASDSDLLCATAHQPVSVAIEGSSLDFQLYTGGIFEGDCSSNPEDLNHALLIVGYGSQDGKDYWIVKNSWSTRWGINGYGYIRRNTNLPYGVCAINALASYPTQTSSLFY